MQVIARLWQLQVSEGLRARAQGTGLLVNVLVINI
jgi:hypothetical protein